MALAHLPLPPPLVDLKKMPELTSYVAARLNLTGDGAAALTLRAENEASADQIERIFDASLAMTRQMMEAEIAKKAASNDPVEQAMAKYSKRMSERVLAILRPVRKGNTFTSAISLSGLNNGQLQLTALIGFISGRVISAMQSMRAAQGQQDFSRRTKSGRNIREVTLSLRACADIGEAFPARANFDKQGKPLLSWRVHILPYMEQKALYKQFHLDEPWDSEHNQKLIPLMPTLFRNPTGTAGPGKANYLAVCGKGLMFDGSEVRKLDEITDGMSNTIALVEVNDDAAVTWTKPDDWEYDANRPLAGWAGPTPAVSTWPVQMARSTSFQALLILGFSTPC